MYCVYKHTSPSGKVYIGITKRTPNARWKNGLGYENNRYFTNAIRKYGWENFKHEILYDSLSLEDACYYEKYFIEVCKATDSAHGYNIRSGGIDGNISQSTRKKMSEKMIEFYKNHPERIEMIRQRVLGYRHTEETKEKMRLCGKSHPDKLTDDWKKHIGESNKKRLLADTDLYEDTAKRCRENGEKAMKSVVQMDMCGNIVAVYQSAHAAERETGIRNGNISKCCNGKAKSASGFKWQYAFEITSDREAAIQISQETR